MFPLPVAHTRLSEQSGNRKKEQGRDDIHIQTICIDSEDYRALLTFEKKMPMDCTNNVSCGAFYLIITGVIARDDVDKTCTIICLNVGPIEEIDCQFFGTGCTKSSI